MSEQVGMKLGLNALVVVTKQVIEDADTHDEMNEIGAALIGAAASVAATSFEDASDTRTAEARKAAWLRDCEAAWDKADSFAVDYATSEQATAPGGTA